MAGGKDQASLGHGHNHAGHQHGDHDHDHDGEGHADHGHDDHDHAAHDHSGHDHAGHSHAPAVSAANERVVLIGFLLTAGFMFAEVIAGFLSGSLALIADAGHMLTDAAALLLAWAAFRFGRRASDGQRTFGYMRLEVVAGFVNALLLFALTAWIIYEAIQRFMTPHEVLAGPMFVVAVLGLVVNIVVFLVLSRGDKAHVNIRGAMVHVLGDLLGSVAAIGAAVVIWLTGWMPIDPILSVLVSLLILRSGWVLFRNSLHILMEGTPGNVVIEDLSKALVAKVPGLAAVRHVHVWSITSGKPVATLEIALAAGADAAGVTRAVKTALMADYGITHATVEVVWGDMGAACALVPDSVSLDSGTPSTFAKHSRLTIRAWQHCSLADKIGFCAPAASSSPIDLYDNPDNLFVAGLIAIQQKGPSGILAGAEVSIGVDPAACLAFDAQGLRP